MWRSVELMNASGRPARIDKKTECVMIRAVIKKGEIQQCCQHTFFVLKK
jgi:hypothetical protein